MISAEQNIRNIGVLMQARNSRKYMAPSEAIRLCASTGKGLRRNGSLLKGDTRPLRYALSAMGCRWSSTRHAWIATSNEHAKEIVKAQQEASQLKRTAIS